jgi:hypothetical protein
VVARQAGEPNIESLNRLVRVDIRLVFLCSRRCCLQEMEECPELYDELTTALRALVP